MRHCSEELGAFSPAFRRALEDAGLRPETVKSAEDFARIAPQGRAALAASGPAHVLVLDPRAIRERWSPLRKLAFSFGGRRVRTALPRSYLPALRLETRGRSAEPLGVWSTAFDVEVARELGRRNCELLELSPAASRVLALTGGGTDVAGWHMREALVAAGVPSTFAPPPRGARAAHALRATAALRPTALVGAPSDLLRFARAARAGNVRLDAVELAVLVAEPANVALRARIAAELKLAGAASELRLAAAYGLAEVRTLFVECPAEADAPTGLHLFPDTILAECVEPTRELLLTPLVGHGTAVFRYRTGDRVPAGPIWTRCETCGRGLPRIGPVSGRLDETIELGGGAQLDFAALRERLDARTDVLEWQLVTRGSGLLLRVAAAEKLAPEKLEADVRAAVSGKHELPQFSTSLHSEQEMLDFLATPHEMLERRRLDVGAARLP